MINSLLVTINQLLPPAVLLVFALVLHVKPLGRKRWLILALWLVVPTLSYILSLEQISQWFDYLGFEYSQMLLVALLVLAALSGLALRLWASFVLLLASASCLYLSHYLPWLLQGQMELARALGVCLGVGIVGSFAILFYFFLTWLAEHYGPWGVLGLFSMHIAGSMVGMLDIAAGAGLLTMPSPLVDLRTLLDEHSIFGRLAKVVVGYEATPSSLSLWVYILTLLALLGAAKWQRSRQECDI
ncbi:hypothetical protein [Pseudoalteromonas sp. T1lg22]|uniref:hypothetical protein n=1 Tax=Pseudoalteromonas sp. T1lg22 TaxID=2077096 RepID=UPI000CF6CF28|nr:hypothetical protein [Pseudoalteromonas sp. T1lg22]